MAGHFRVKSCSRSGQEASNGAKGAGAAGWPVGPEIASLGRPDRIPEFAPEMADQVAAITNPVDRV